MCAAPQFTYGDADISTPGAGANVRATFRVGLAGCISRRLGEILAPPDAQPWRMRSAGKGLASDDPNAAEIAAPNTGPFEVERMDEPKDTEAPGVDAAAGAAS
mmetsp:Transcript_54926/g.154061  ORF Transcript_54926/g.154061 Transcript_54926/m.154061 type:complete len:103 (+) Transcript_54926:369-677(+)